MLGCFEWVVGLVVVLLSGSPHRPPALEQPRRLPLLALRRRRQLTVPWLCRGGHGGLEEGKFSEVSTDSNFPSLATRAAHLYELMDHAHDVGALAERRAVVAVPAGI